MKGGPDPRLAEATIFETGSNVWRRDDTYQPAGAARRTLYFPSSGNLAFAPPATSRGPGFDRYLIDPNRPVPTVGRIEGNGMPHDHPTFDQHSSLQRPDVLT
jgi:predicted acyl esterase